MHIDRELNAHMDSPNDFKYFLLSIIYRFRFYGIALHCITCAYTIYNHTYIYLCKYPYSFSHWSDFVAKRWHIHTERQHTQRRCAVSLEANVISFVRSMVALPHDGGGKPNNQINISTFYFRPKIYLFDSVVGVFAM